MANSVVDGLGWDPTNSGLVIGSDQVSITGSVIRNNYIGAYLIYTGVANRNVTIDECLITDNQLGIQIYQQQFMAMVKITDTDLVSNTNVGMFLQSDLPGAGKADVRGCWIEGSSQGMYILGEGVYEISDTTLLNNSMLGLEVQGVPPGSPVLSVLLRDVSISLGDTGIKTENTALEARNLSIDDTALFDLDVSTSP
jgi:hypothetical protein